MDMIKAGEILKKVFETTQQHTDLQHQTLYSAIRDCTQKVDVGYYKRVIDSFVVADLLRVDLVKNDQGELVNRLYNITPEGMKLVKVEEHGQA